MTISDWQKKVDEWIKKYGVRYFDVMTNTLLLSEEVGEFSRLVARSYGEQSYKKEKSPASVKKELSEELADIIFVVSCLANQMDINLENELENNIRKKTNRDKTRHHENIKLRNK